MVLRATEPLLPDRRPPLSQTPAMPRHARVAVPGQPHDVMQRGNRRADVFFPLVSAALPDGVGPGVWQAHLAEPLTEEDAERLRDRTQSGLPCGDEGFLARVSEVVGRTLIVRGRGRPRKAAEERGRAE